MSEPPTPEQLAAELDELAVLWPALPAALARDAGTSSGERVSTSENVHTIPLNADVASTMHRLNAAIPNAAYLRNLATVYTEHYDNHRTRQAARLADTIAGWLRDARHALGLDRPDRPLRAAHCPRHDEPLTKLVEPGDRGWLRYDHLDAHGRPVNPWVSWLRHEAVTCRHCGAVWSPGQYLWLGRLIEDADRRRAARDDGPNDHPESEVAA